jgi:malyl-CoA/(S)-citramalyl-CoA lyase
VARAKSALVRVGQRVGDPPVAGPDCHQAFTPDSKTVEQTRRVIAAMREAAEIGKGAVSLDGKLVDAASLKMARNLLAKL